MAETSRDPKEVDKSLNLMVNNYLIGTERVLGKKDLHYNVTTSLVDQEPELEPEEDIDMNESPSRRDQLKTLIMQQKNELIETMHNTRTSCARSTRVALSCSWPAWPLRRTSCSSTK